MNTTTTKVLMPLAQDAQAEYDTFGLSATEMLENEHIKVVYVDPAGEPLKPRPEMLKQPTYKFVVDDQGRSKEDES